MAVVSFGGTGDVLYSKIKLQQLCMCFGIRVRFQPILQRCLYGPQRTEQGRGRLLQKHSTVLYIQRFGQFQCGGSVFRQRLVCAGSAASVWLLCRGASCMQAFRASSRALSALVRAVFKALLPLPNARFASVRLLLQKRAEYIALALSGRLCASSTKNNQSPEESKNRFRCTTGSNR